jgi:two-component system chemotaxis response regulator CheY
MAKVVLVVDTSSSIIKFVSLSLKMVGYNVVPAFDGMEALEKIANVDIDMIITDLNLPIIDGINLIKTIRENIVYSHTPIIILTALSNEKNIQEAMEAGANSYLLKPFNEKILLAEVNKYFK